MLTKNPTSPRTQLSLCKQYSGLALLDIQKYYQAIHLGRVIDCQRHSNFKLWAQMEQTQINIPLKSAIWCYDTLPQELKYHPLVGTTLQLSSQASLQAFFTSRDSLLLPILGNPQNPPGLQSSEFKNLRHLNYDHASKFIVAGRWPSIMELTNNPRGFNRQLTTF